MVSLAALFCPLLLLLTLSLTLTSCGAAVIDDMCSATVEPSICLDCQKSNPNSKTDDGQALILHDIQNCTFRDLNYLLTDTQHESTIATYPPLQYLLSKCTDKFTEAESSLLDGVRRFVSEKNYASAITEIEGYLLPKITFCLKQFVEEPKFPLPPKVLVGTNIVKQQTQVMQGMVQFLLSGGKGF